MKRTFLFSKIHRAVVTEVNIGYEGSIGIDEELIKAAGFRPYERVDVYNVTNGERFSTYVVKAPAGSGQINIFGAAGHKARLGDLIIIAAYAELEENEVDFFRPKIVLVDEKNRVKEIH